MDDATSTIYSAFLVEEEGTASTFRGLLEVTTVNGDMPVRSVSATSGLMHPGKRRARL
jgi:hypothetical protein